MKQACVRESGKRSRPVRQVIFLLFFPPAGAQCDSGLLVSKCCSSGCNYRLSASAISSTTSLATIPLRTPGRRHQGCESQLVCDWPCRGQRSGGAKLHGKAAAASVPLKERATVSENCSQCFMGQLDNERLGVCEGRKGPQLHTDSREVNWGSNPAGFSTSHAHQHTL